MARNDRESTFEKALARHLRADTPAPPGGAVKHSCADAETLAAYHERLLAPEEMTQWKEHISACSRCQEILAQVELTHAVPVDAAKGEPQLPVAPAEQKAPVLPIFKSRRRWLWAAPAGALAAGLLVWIVLQDNPQRFEVAKNQPAPVLLPPTASSSEPVSTAVQPSVNGNREKATSPVQSRTGDIGALRGSKKLAEPKAPGTRSAKPVPLKDLHDDRLDALNAAQPTLDAKQGAGAVGGALKSDKQSTSAAAPPVPAMAETVEVSNEAAQLAPQPGTPTAPEKLSKAKARTPSAEFQSQPRQLQQTEGMSRSRFSEAPTMVLAGAQGPATVPAPNSKVSWRVGRAGAIERSEDAGGTWSLQVSGVVNDLVAGSAPSDKVCWVVGQLGTILRTTDGGATWTKVRSPIADDIRLVFAVSDQQATIFAAHASYRTVDGGVTWNELLPE